VSGWGDVAVVSDGVEHRFGSLSLSRFPSPLSGEGVA
jgi:hypothetical protein